MHRAHKYVIIKFEDRHVLMCEECMHAMWIDIQSGIPVGCPGGNLTTKGGVQFKSPTWTVPNLPAKQ